MAHLQLRVSPESLGFCCVAWTLCDLLPLWWLFNLREPQTPHLWHSTYLVYLSLSNQRLGQAPAVSRCV